MDLWGTLAGLPGPPSDGEVLGISGDGTDTYLSGWNGAATASPVPCFWKVRAAASQPTPAALSTEGGAFGKAVYATFNGSAPYFSGYYTVAAVDHPCYWTADGTYIDLTGCLPSDAQGGRANAVFLK